MIRNLYKTLKMSRIFIKYPLLVWRLLSVNNYRKLTLALDRMPLKSVASIIESRLSSLAKNSERNYKMPASQRTLDLESKYPGITAPNALSNIYMLEEKLRAVPVSVFSTEKERVNILLPQLDPLIMFGGYISCLQFIRALVTNDYNVRILLCETQDFDFKAVKNKLEKHPEMVEALDKCEIINITKKEDMVSISENDAFIAYSVWTGILAHSMASVIGKKFIFFIQEYEPIFHVNDSYHAMANYAYRLPHYALFNTEILRNYFRKNKLGVFSLSEQEGNTSSCSFQHALTKTSPPTLDVMAGRKKKRFLFYGRPEDHAKRNMFEVGLIGLKMAVYDGVFDDDWEFVGVGTLGTEHNIELGNGRVMNLSSTLPLNDYALALKEFDLGMSLMYAPHPSIIPFEMAASGLVVITNSYLDRNKDILEDISKNIVACEPDMYSVCDAIKYAVRDKISNYEDRVANASIDWVMDWDDSFNDDVMASVDTFIKG